MDLTEYNNQTGNLFEKEEFFLNMVNQMVLARKMELKAYKAFKQAEARYHFQVGQSKQTEERCKRELKAYCESKGIEFNESYFN